MIRKTFTLSEDSVKKIEERDRTVYRKEYQYVEAAIQFFAKHGEGKKKDELELLNEILENTKAIKRKVVKSSDEFEIDEKGVPLHLAKYLE